MYNSSYKNFCKSQSSNDLKVNGRFDSRYNQNHTFNKFKTIPEDDITDAPKINELSDTIKKTTNLTKWAGMVFQSDNFKRKLNDVKFFNNAKYNKGSFRQSDIDNTNQKDLVL